MAQKQKDYLKAAFYHIVGDKSSKSQADHYLKAKWTKIHDWKSSQGDSPEHLSDLALWRLLEGKGPCVVLTTGRGAGGEQAVFGGFWQGKVPSVPEPFEPGPELEHDVEAKDGDFCFCYLPTQDCHYHYISAEDFPLA